MCSPEIMAKVASVSRRRFVRSTGALGLAASVGSFGAFTRSAGGQEATPVAGASPVATGGPFSTILDLTHTWGEDFPVFPGAEQPTFEVIVTIESGGFFKSKLSFDEHTGTHMDAPIHFAEDGLSADMLPPENFFAPLAIVDISNRAAGDPDAQGTVDDILAWEAANGQLPAGAFVALNSGWAAKVDDPEAFLNVDADGVPHFPGWHPDATAMLVNERDIVGMGVDTVSLDFGASTDFGTHLTLLPAGKFGIENLANLGSAPGTGARVIIGGPKHENASGGPSRVYAVM